MCPLAPDFLAGGDFVCHCLLVETPSSGLVLVDTGLGTGDVTRPERLPLGFRTFLRPKLDRRETAVERVRALGYEREDVRHVVVTHLDLDHAGGLPDFPEAAVHLHAPERQLIDETTGFIGRERRLPEHWSHGPDWRTYTPEGDTWFGFDAVRDLDGLRPEILIVPLAGHTRGHSGVAVETDEGWLLHAGDAYFSRGDITDEESSPPAVRAFQAMIAEDGPARIHNQQRLRELHDEEDVRIFCAHDSEEFAPQGD